MPGARGEAAATPFAVDVEKSKDYYWCACGLGKSQPFCDGTHKGGEFVPAKYSADKSTSVYFCGCKQCKNGALYVGAHKGL